MNRRITYALMRREAGGKALMRGKGIAIHGLYTSRTNDVTIEVHNKCKTQFVMERSTECTQKSAISSRQVPPDGMSESLLCSIYIYIYIYTWYESVRERVYQTLSLSLSLSLTHTHTSVPQQSRTPVANPKMPRPLQTVQENGVEESRLKGRLQSIKPFSFWRSNLRYAYKA